MSPVCMLALAADATEKWKKKNITIAFSVTMMKIDVNATFVFKTV